MLTTLAPVQDRLAILPGETTFDSLLTNAIKSVSARFDKETRRTLARTENATFEFDPSDTQILVPCYPVESVSKFELKQNETDGWLEQTDIQYLIRNSCLISLASPPVSSLQPAAFPAIARLTHTGGYVPPGTTSQSPNAP